MKKKLFINVKRLVPNAHLSFSTLVLTLFSTVALLAPLISNNKPLLVVIDGKLEFPLLEDEKFDEKKIDRSTIILNPPFSYTNIDIDLDNANYVSPFSEQNILHTKSRHWLGTDLIGHDVLAGIIYGARIALVVGFFSMLVSLIIGLLLGSIAGYWADDRIKINLLEIIIVIPLPFLIFFYGFYIHKYEWINALAQSNLSVLITASRSFLYSFTVFIATVFLLFLERKITKAFLKPRWFLPLDFLINRGIEIFESLPTMFLIIALMAVVKPSLYYVVLIIGLTSWPPIARYTRNELLRIRKLEFIEAAHALGFGNARIIFKHALPNAINPILIALAFGVASAIIAESTLSFLGIGISTDQVTWGSMLASARQSPEAWWLIVFPGFMIFIVVLALNKLGDGLVKRMDNRIGV